jgi:hypothetical protein
MLGDGNGYQPTPTGAILHWFQVCSQMPGFTDRLFVDIGAGKGKVLREWRKQLWEAGLQQDCVGVESSRELSDALCATALTASFDVIIGDATEVDWSMFEQPLLCWLFNPFDTDSVRKLNAAMLPVDVLMVMNNPEHATALLELGWHLVDLTYGGDSMNSWFLLGNREVVDNV